MVYSAGRTDHTIRSEEMVDHIVGLVSAKAEAMAEAARAAAAEAARQAAE
jgi:(E)-4-hydroxy-3-methylbut-2-enyl-diphosphate synthase